MKPLRKKSKSLERDNRVYMPYKKGTLKPLRKAKFHIFKKAKPVTSLRKGPLKIPKVAIYFILITIFGTILFGAIKYINKLRNTEETHEQTYVIGLENIPAYPESTFIFTNSTSEESVRNFLSKGNSAYRLPNDTTINDVFEYYNEKLPTLGWTLVLTVPLESDTQEYGQYWTTDGIGLRIYSKYNDVWYETITKSEAENGLSERVQAENERDLLLIDDDAQDLLPDFPWILSVPKEYLISYKVSAFDDTLQQLTISKIGADEKIALTPAAKLTSSALDYALEDYIKTLNTSGDRWEIINTYVISSNIGTALRGTIQNSGEEHEIAVLPNSYNDIVYVLDTNEVNGDFFNYILENIKIQDSTVLY